MTHPLLHGKTALVTGAARGIGLAVARAMAAHGARVVLADRAGAEAAAAASGARALALDVTDEAATESAFDALAAEGWAPDIVVPNAGILHLEVVDRMPADRFRAVLEVNLTGAFLTARAAARRMEAGGRIILTSSLFGLRGGTQNAAYSASKFGMVGLMESMAADLAPRGILVNAVAPGQIQTEMIDQLVADRLAMGLPDPRERLLSRIPMARLGTPEEVAGAYVWLASPLASYVTGQTVVVDGGWQVG
jgi:NAD(P)-dependent dehydrogenase (short-subunit alcohol dehydrogenase family)